MKSYLKILSAALISTGCLSTNGPTALNEVGEPNQPKQPFVEAYIEYLGAPVKWSGPSAFILHVEAKEPGFAKVTASHQMTPVSAPKVNQRILASMTRLRAEEDSAEESAAISGGVGVSADEKVSGQAVAKTHAQGAEQVGAQVAAAHATADSHGKGEKKDAAAVAGVGVGVGVGVGARADAEAGTGGITTEAARERILLLASSMEGEAPEYHGCLSPVRIRLIRADGSFMEKHGCRTEASWPGFASQTVSYFLQESGQI